VGSNLKGGLQALLARLVAKQITAELREQYDLAE
jgi:hypothetical protein